ncbi:MAG TPA: hypothetical protein VGF92_02400 [Stellaceae bacterium]|jgi:hypothetical protein
MNNIRMMMSGSAVIVALAAALLVQGCTMPQTNASANVYDGNDYVAALDAAMTSDDGGE